jgi:signal transduction histidine kinase/ActR/RegA family two-component response regulator
MGFSSQRQKFHIPSLDRCPVTGLPVRHDPRWVVTDAGASAYRAEFSVIGSNIVHAHIDGYTTIDIAKRYLNTLDALCEEIGSVIYFMEDYSLHKGTSGEARNYYLKRQTQNRRLAATIFFGASPFFSAAIRVGRFFARVPFTVELERDYTAAVKVAVALQAASPLPHQEPAATIAGREPDWKLETVTFSVSYWVLPDNVLFGKAQGEIRTVEEIAQFEAFYRKVLGEWDVRGTESFRLMDWTDFKYISWKARLLYVKVMKELHTAYPCQLGVIYGMSPFARAAYNISRHLMHPIPTITASDFKDGMEKIRKFAAAKSTPPAEEAGKEKHSLKMEDVERRIRDLLDFMGTINWEQNGIPVDSRMVDNKSPFRPLYEAMIILKQDYDEIAREKRASELHQRELEEKLRHSERMQSIGMLAGGIAHDFNNQLAAIMGFAELIKDKGADNSTIAKYADSILQTSKRTAELTAQLLAFARKGKYLSVAVDVHKLVDEIVTMLNHSIDKMIVLQKELRASSFTIIGDPSQLQSALLNLAINARDAMPHGGNLRFSTKTLHLSAQDCCNPEFDLAPGPHVQLCISDTGCGMTQEARKHLFEPFFTTKEPGKGTGLGLAAVYGTVKSHKGAIKIISEQGHGTVIELLFPCAPETRQSGTDEKKEKTTGCKPCRVLLVEDEPDIRKVVSEMLTTMGHFVTTANNGKEAVDLYSKSWREIDLILLDLIMPQMGGSETFHLLKETNHEAKILISSGYSIEGEAQTLLAAGAIGFLQKPFKASELSKAVLRAVNA